MRVKRALLIAAAGVAVVAGAAGASFVYTATVNSATLFDLMAYCAKGCTVRALPNGMFVAVREDEAPPPDAPQPPLMRY